MSMFCTNASHVGPPHAARPAHDQRDLRRVKDVERRLAVASVVGREDHRVCCPEQARQFFQHKADLKSSSDADRSGLLMPALCNISL